ncbi:glutathione S-transferase [Maritimibacter sp. 55A14]|uniref:glutathione S-transferase n=1 Tax=Maritimibacter sp. 55A14 TaxID=2174844 RepID=UPI000D616DA2|nr:glutathione S-transferase [Maritimibacter sp. 55A14]PWE31163.1 glutathione S-transferase [Maritimibacter sp. 55A14]
MDYELVIGDRTHSSWSLRGWLLLERFGLPVRTRMARLYSGDFDAVLSEYAPARLVPVLRTPGGVVVQDTLAIAETLAERHPDAGIWPADPAARAAARWLAAEMHSGFQALRTDCPMHLGVAYGDFEPPPAVLDDLARIRTLWDMARGQADGEGPWLFGAYCAADAFYAPVAARIAGYGLPVDGADADYVAAHLADPAFRRWRAMGRAEGVHQPVYDRPWRQVTWPGPALLEARAAAAGPSENAACPYSGKPVTHFLDIGDRRFGFCNAFCRDKTLADPEAWPAFMAIYDS